MTLLFKQEWEENWKYPNNLPTKKIRNRSAIFLEYEEVDINWTDADVNYPWFIWTNIEFKNAAKQHRVNTSKSIHQEHSRSVMK